MKKKDNASAARRGSALVIVLGILAVIMLLAVAFTTFVRTELAGSTNLKNGLVARQALDSAIGHVMEAIDLSFGGVSNDWPVCIWPEPWLASSGNPGNDYYQSARRSGRTAARVLTAEAAEYLSPAQLALASSAECDWAPLYGAISTDYVKDSGSGNGFYGRGGVNHADGIIGRYAFVALETTGLLDMNRAGFYQGSSAAATAQASARAKSDAPSQAEWFVLPTGTNKFAFKNLTVTAPTQLAKWNAFATARNNDDAGFSSLADLRAAAETALDDPDQYAVNADGKHDGAYLPADLFATATPSLTPFLNPDGDPVVPLPTGSQTGSSSEMRKFAKVAYTNMVRVFAHSRADAWGDGAATDASADQIELYGGSLKLSRPRLATVALLDALDDGSGTAHWLPGSLDGGQSYWRDLKDGISTTVSLADGPKTVSEPALGSLVDNAANFPMTEPLPCLSWTYAYFTLEGDGRGGAVSYEPDFNAAGFDPARASSDPADYHVIYSGTVHLGAVALLADATNSIPAEIKNKLKLKLDYEVLPEFPAVGGSGGGNVRALLDDGTLIVWDGLFKNSSVTVSEVAGGTTAISLHAKAEWPVTITCQAKTVPSTWGGGGGGGGGRPAPPEADAPQPAGRDQEEAPVFYPMCKAAVGDPVNPRAGGVAVFVPVRMKATISVGDEVVQQVPAPAISDKWIRMNMGVWHNWNAVAPEERYHWGSFTARDIVQVDEENVVGPFAPGWAMCTCPTFAMDTTSLNTKVMDQADAGSGLAISMSAVTDPVRPTMFWVNDGMARYAALDATTDFGKLCKKLVTYFDSTPTQLEGAERTGPAALFNWLQYEYLFGSNGAEGKGAMLPVHGSTDRTRFLPDALHSQEADGDPFASGGGSSWPLDRWRDDALTHIQNRAFGSVGELGRVMCGPYETLSLFKTFRPKDFTDNKGGADFHRVLDYFGSSNPRVSADDKELFDALYLGRVNLNAPRLVTMDGPTMGKTSDVRNPYPIAAALTGVPLSDGDSSGLKPDDALAIAAAIVQGSGAEEENRHGFAGKTVTDKIVRGVADLGNCDDTVNTLLDRILQLNGVKSDESREAVLARAADSFTTRGQTFLVVIRADAYTPRYGEETAEDGGGTTLATTHAVVELFRDPETARYPDGTPMEDKDGNPVYFHNWYIKAVHVL